MIRCLIVDDEPMAHQVLEHYIAQTPALTLVGKCRNAIEAFESLKAQPVDLLFLDIEMPLVNGIHFLKTITNPPKTILTTAYKEYAFDGYELGVIDYLLKPFSYERFEKALEKFEQVHQAQTATPKEEKFLLVKERQGMVKVSQGEILYVEGCKDYVKLVTLSKTYLMHQTMKGMLDELQDPFVRVHRSFIVSAAHIKLIQSENLILSNDVYIPIGQLYKKDLLEHLRK